MITTVRVEQDYHLSHCTNLRCHFYQLIQLEQECRQLTEVLIKNDQEPILDEELLQKKVKIIHQILADDAQIRAITEPWMMKLQDMLYTNSRTRNLQLAYQPVSNL